MPNSDKQSQVSIEDLLHLKKFERPSADFWANFESELRQKQLSALVKKPAWWRDLPHFFARRVYLPIGATAILTFTLVSVKYYTSAQVVQNDNAAVVPVAVANSNTDERSSVTAYSAPVSSPLVNRTEQQSVAVENTLAVASVNGPAQTTADLSAASTFSDEKSPSARSIAANLARLEQSEPELINSVLGSRLSSPARLQTTATPVVELASLQMNGGKRSRLLAHYNDRQSSSTPASADAVRERLSRRLGDSDFNDSFTRIGLKGDQVSLKF